MEQLDIALSPVGGLRRARADDIGVVIKALRHVARLEPVFWDFEGAAGLALHAGKGVVVPVAEGGSDTVIRRMRRQLPSLVPAWADFRVEMSGRYLGYALGPACGGEMWRRAEAEWVKRTRALASGSAPPRVCAAQYNSRALPVLSYSPLLVEVPMQRFRGAERREVNRMLRFPGNVLPQRALVDLVAHGSPRIRSAKAATTAAGGCAAMHVLQRRPEVVEEYGTLAERADGAIAPRVWDTRAMVHVVTLNRTLAAQGGAQRWAVDSDGRH